MSLQVIAEITQYGRSVKAGGWDIDGDDDTDKFEGNIGTIYSGVDCAVTDSMRAALGGPADGKWLRIIFHDKNKNAVEYRRRIGDRAPESDKRVDFFNYWAFDHQQDGLGDYALVELIPDGAVLVAGKTAS